MHTFTNKHTQTQNTTFVPASTENGMWNPEKASIPNNGIRKTTDDDDVYSHSLVLISELYIQVLQLCEELALVSPHVKLLNQFRYYEKGAPPADLLRLENVTEYVITDVQHVFALCVYQLGEHVARTCRS